MLHKLLQNWRARRGRFAAALADRQKVPKHTNGLDLWCLYRLGMYQSVVERSQNDRDVRGIFARAVSNAACGNDAEAAVNVRDLLAQPNASSQWVALADALAPFLPALALEVCLATSDRASPALYAALLLRNGQVSDAQEIIQRAIGTEEASRQPELFLYRSNAFQLSPSDRLADLNRFLFAKGVPGVELKSEFDPPSTVNLRSRGDGDFCEGPLVSILMTTFRTARRVDSAIESILGQSYRNIELIVVDDASDDDTPLVIQQWANRDPRVRFIRLARNGGTYVAKNIGLSHASGEFVTCHDSDDWSHPQKIERQVRPLLDNRKLIATTSNWVRIQDDGQYYARPVYPLMRLNPSSPLFRRKEVVERMGIWDCVRTGADSEFLARMRLVFGRKAVKRIAQPLALGAHRADSLMTATATGYGASGLSPTRLDYWESWSQWHLDCLRRKISPRLPADISDMLSGRSFAVSKAIEVEPSEIRACMESVTLDGGMSWLDSEHPIMSPESSRRARVA